MSELPDAPKFDKVARFEVEREFTIDGWKFIEENQFDVVYHLDAEGEPFAWHSPLDDGVIRCTICEGGARVYLA